MQVKDIMTMSPVVVTPGDSITLAAQCMRDWDIGVLPVVEDRRHKRLVGVITDRDVVVRCIASAHSDRCSVGDHMTPSPIVTTFPESEIHLAIDAMRHGRVRRIPVVDASELLLGMLTQADIARHLAGSDATVVARLVEEISQPAAAAV